MKQGEFYDKTKYNLAFKMNNSNKRFYNNMKSKIDNSDEQNLIYKIQCKGNEEEQCDGIYIGTTKNKLKTRLSGHKSNFKNLNNNYNKTALTQHCSDLKHNPDFDNIQILQKEDDYDKRLLLEMLHIISTPVKKRINFKTDTDNLAHSYRNIIQQHNIQK